MLAQPLPEAIVLSLCVAAVLLSLGMRRDQLTWLVVRTCSRCHRPRSGCACPRPRR